MFFELKEYWAKPGQRDRYVKFHEEVVIPFQISKGMVIVGSFVDQEDEDHYVWMRRFSSEQERERLYTAVFESETWKNDIAPKSHELLDFERSLVTRIDPTPKSVMQ